MRSSSVKTTIATLTISATLIAAAPSVAASPTQSRETVVVERAAGPADRAFRAAERILRRLVGGRVTVNSDQPSVPIPGSK